jgi:hypothetical protein
LLVTEVLAKPITQSKKESPRLIAGVSTFTFLCDLKVCKISVTGNLKSETLYFYVCLLSHLFFNFGVKIEKYFQILHLK